MEQKPSILKNLLFSFIIVSLFFGALEVQQRARYYWKTGNRYYLYYGGSRFVLSLKKIFYSARSLLNLDTKGVERPDLIIAALGGSTTYWILSQDNSYIAQIKVALHERFPSEKIEVYNWGSPGSTSRSDLRRLRENIAQLPVDGYPDILIIYTGINDAYMAQGVPKDGDSIYHPFYVRLNYVLMHYSLFYRCIYERVHNNRPIPTERTAHYDDVDYGKQVDYVMKRLKDSLYEMISLCRNNDIAVIISIHPISDLLLLSSDPDDKRFIGLYSKMCGVILSVAKETGIPLVDLRKDVKDARYFNDPIHFNIDGSKKAAQSLLPAIISLKGIIDQEIRVDR